MILRVDDRPAAESLLEALRRERILGYATGSRELRILPASAGRERLWAAVLAWQREHPNVLVQTIET